VLPPFNSKRRHVRDDLSLRATASVAVLRRLRPKRSGPRGATVVAVVARAFLRFKTLPRNVRLLWVVAAFIALNVAVRFVG